MSRRSRGYFHLCSAGPHVLQPALHAGGLLDRYCVEARALQRGQQPRQLVPVPRATAQPVEHVLGTHVHLLLLRPPHRVHEAWRWAEVLLHGRRRASAGRRAAAGCSRAATAGNYEAAAWATAASVLARYDEPATLLLEAAIVAATAKVTAAATQAGTDCRCRTYPTSATLLRPCASRGGLEWHMIPQRPHFVLERLASELSTV